MSAALLKINKSVCHLCVALNRHATVHLGPFAKNIGSWILKSRLASGKLRDKQTNQTVKKKRGGWKLSSCGLFHRSSSQMGNYFYRGTTLADGWTAGLLRHIPPKILLSAQVQK